MAKSLHDSEGKIFIEDRGHIWLEDANDRLAEWIVPSLRELFRGNKQPSKDMDHYPEEYCEVFFAIEKNVLMISELGEEILDEEMMRLYSAMRRRPDGHSEGFLHDVIYQSAALALGLYPLSQAEFEAIFNQLTRSARIWRESYSSKNYICYLRESFLEDVDNNPGMDVLLKRIKNSHDKAVIVKSNDQMEKMSQVILNFAQPLLDETEDPEIMKTAVTLAIIAWNASLLPAAIREELIQTLTVMDLPFGFKEEDKVARQSLEMLIERKKEFFPEYKRLIADFQCETIDDGIHLNVVSVDSEEESRNFYLKKPAAKSLLTKIRERLKRN